MSTIQTHQQVPAQRGAPAAHKKHPIPKGTQTAAQRQRTETQVENANKAKKLTNNKKLGQESFLKLLVTQIRHQDPTKPMEDKQFISQMAQFSSLEQMSNLNRQFKSFMASTVQTNGFSLIGKTVEAAVGKNKKVIKGVVDSVQVVDKNIKLMVNGQVVEPKELTAVYNNDYMNNSNRSAVQAAPVDNRETK